MASSSLALIVFGICIAFSVGVALYFAALFITDDFCASTIKRMDIASLIAAVLGVVGFVGFNQVNTGLSEAFATFRSAGLFMGLDVLCGVLFAVGFVAYAVFAVTGILSPMTRKIFLAVVAILGIFFTYGAGYVGNPDVLTAENWNPHANAILLLACMVVAGLGVTALVLSLCKEDGDGSKPRMIIYETAFVAVLLMVVALVSVCYIANILLSAKIASSSLVAPYLPELIVGCVFCVGSIALLFPATSKKLSVACGVGSFVCALVSVVCLHFAGYGIVLGAAACF